MSSERAFSVSDNDTKGNTAEDVARMVFAFVAASKGFAEGMDKSDEVKLLRLRTRKTEIVIVPGRSNQRTASCSALTRDPCPQIPNFSSLSFTIPRQHEMLLRWLPLSIAYSVKSSGVYPNYDV